MKINSILESIGNTPVLRLSKLFPTHNVWIKLEKANPGGSIKDRIALSMIETAEKDGSLKPGMTIIEPTSGNTGVGLAMVAAVKGYDIVLVMPESMSVERRALMTAYGAKFDLTPKELGMKGAIARAAELGAKSDKNWIPAQFSNEANTEAHRKTTALEIIEDFSDGLDYLITGVGTGGHITGISEIVKQKFPNLKTLAVEPTDSPVISGGEPGPHPLQGIGAGFIPDIFNIDTIDGTVQVSKEEAFAKTKEIATQEGVLVGISTGASLAAVEKTLPTIDKNATVLTMNYDTGERYLSIEGLLS